MNLYCVKCNAEIKSENVNISTDLAKCDACGSIHKASELNRPVTKRDQNPPRGSKIILNKGFGNTIELIYPKRGFTLSIIPQLFFALFWIGFIGFWTWGASRGSVFFAMFSIPFWFVGLGMIAGIINTMNEIQTITLTKYEITLKKQRPIRPKTFVTEVEDIQSIKMKPLKLTPFSGFGNLKYMMKMQRSFGNNVEVPAIISGRKTQYFFEDANDAEQEWVTQTLNSMVQETKAKR